MSPVDRRSFLKGLAVASATAAGAAAQPAGTPQASRERAQRVTWSKAPCPLCPVGCGMLVGTERSRLVALKGDPDSPVNRGLACAKGYHAGEMLYGEDRFTSALIRSNGRLQPASLKEALDLVAQRIRDTQAQHGKDSVAVCSDQRQSLTDAHISLQLFRDALGSASVDTSAGVHAASGNQALMDAFGMPFPPGCYEDIDNADIFILWNSNLAETHPVLFSRMLERRRTNPSVRIVVLGTRATRTSYAADQSFIMNPATELFVANTLCQELIARKLHHRDYVDRYVSFKRSGGEGTFDDFTSFLSGYTATRAEQVSGVPAETIRWLATLYGDRAKKITSIWGEGVDGGPRGVWSGNALYNLHLLMGKVGTPGNSPLNVSSGGARVLAASTRDSGATDARGIFDALEKGSVRFLWVMNANPLSELPNLLRLRRVASGTDRFVVVTAAYPDATTDVADVVLPAALWVEAEAILVNGERRVEHVPSLIPAPANATTASWQMLEVARRLGVSRLAWPADEQVDRVSSEYSSARVPASRALPAVATLRGTPGVLWPSTAGREVKWRYSTAHDPAADRARGAADFYGHADHRAWIWMRPYEEALEATDRSFPMILELGTVLEHSGTGAITQRIPVLHRAVPNSYVELNRTDASRLGIRNGQRVRLTSRHGSVEIEARIDYRSQPAPGRLFAPVFDEAAPVCSLLRPERLPATGQHDITFCAVRIEPLAASKP